MKLNGREVKGKNRKTIVLPREGQPSLVFIAEAVSDFERLNQYLALPEPPVKQLAGGAVEKLTKDPGYQEQMIHYNTRFMAWVFLESLKPSNIEWETVDMEDAKTWTNYRQEMQDAGISGHEMNLIANAVSEANSLDADKLEAARQVFLRGQEGALKNTSGQNT